MQVTIDADPELQTNPGLPTTFEVTPKYPIGDRFSYEDGTVCTVIGYNLMTHVSRDDDDRGLWHDDVATSRGMSTLANPNGLQDGGVGHCSKQGAADMIAVAQAVPLTLAGVLQRLYARERSDLLAGKVAIPRLDNPDFEAVTKWLPVVASDEGSYTLLEFGTYKVFAGIDLELLCDHRGVRETTEGNRWQSCDSSLLAESITTVSPRRRRCETQAIADKFRTVVQGCSSAHHRRQVAGGPWRRAGGAGISNERARRRLP